MAGGRTLGTWRGSHTVAGGERNSSAAVRESLFLPIPTSTQDYMYSDCGALPIRGFGPLPRQQSSPASSGYLDAMSHRRSIHGESTSMPLWDAALGAEAQRPRYWKAALCQQGRRPHAKDVGSTAVR